MRGRQQRRVVLLGAIFGAVSGVVMALVYQRWSRQRQREGAKRIQTRQLIRLGTSLIPAVRQLLELIS
jgi:hypothetical protein